MLRRALDGANRDATATDVNMVNARASVVGGGEPRNRRDRFKEKGSGSDTKFTVILGKSESSTKPILLGPKPGKSFKSKGDHKHVEKAMSRFLKKAKEEEEEEDLDDHEGTERLVERCRHWPNCLKGEGCQFFHPNELCRFV